MGRFGREPARESSFNPTLVRLRPFHPDRPRGGSHRFQSHAGSIEALASGKYRVQRVGSFNPTLVRLRPDLEVRDYVAHLRFNPTLVRLRHGPRREGSEASPKFQSHAGSIEAASGSSPVSSPAPFQSHAGSIEAVKWPLRLGRRVAVSIPRWFD